MNKHSIQITLLALATVFTVSLRLGYAQAPNLLSNPGFEEAFTKSRWNAVTASRKFMDGVARNCRTWRT
ncbi:MAG UNVERIFIED_CONTAM: hypothetical protein LVT10_24105 [Anaerolineae bacterium]|jgi:hypothetical protein